MAEKIEFDFTVKNNQLSKALDEGSKKASYLGDVLSTALGVFGGSIITKGFDAVVGGFNDLITIGKESIAASAAQEVAVNNLNNALARSGNFTKQASKELQDFAGQLQATTVFEDDVVIANTALLQSLSKLDKDGLQSGVKAAADFATVLGIDLETATRLVAKAAEGNTEAFKRYGVEIKKGSSDSESFANTVEALNAKFGGAAAAQLNTYSGALKAASNAYGDLLEPIGDIIVKNPLIVAGLNSIKDILNETNKEVTILVPTLQDLVTDGLLAASVATQMLMDALDGLTVVGKVLFGTFQNLSGIIGQTLIAPFELLIDSVIFLGSKIPGIGDAFEGLVNPLDGATESMSRLSSEGIDGIVNAASNRNVFRDLSDGLGQYTEKVISNSSAVSIAAAESIKNNKDRKNSEIKINADILAARTQLGIDIIGLQSQLSAEQISFDEQSKAAALETELAQNLAKIEAIANQKIAEAQAVYDGELLKNKAIADGEQQNLANQKAAHVLSLAATKASNAQILESDKALAAEKSRLMKENEANQAETISTIATLQSSGNKTLAAIGKAAALAQIAISGPIAVTKAFELGPILGPPAAVAVAAAVAAQAAKVVGVQFANSGFIGESSGATMGADNTMASVREGEMVLNGDDQKTLFNAIKSGGLGGSSPIVIQIDGREIARAVRDQMQSGFKLA